MSPIFEILLILILIAIQSIFGVGLLLFGTPSFLLFGYDFANTINILMPVSITISSLQFFKSKEVRIMHAERSHGHQSTCIISVTLET